MPLQKAPVSCPREGTACLACGSLLAEPWPPHRPAPEQPLLVCACGLGRVREMPPPDVVAGYYQGDYYTSDRGRRFVGAAERLSAWFKRRRARRIAARLPAGRILDVGCERGVFLDEMRRLGWQATGTQLSRAAVDSAKTDYGLDVHYGELPSLNLPPASFSVVTYFHVLEHLPRPDVYLAETHRLLAEDGLLVVELPNFGSLIARLFREHWFGLDLPRHLYHFDPRSLRLLLTVSGFVVTRVSHFSGEYSVFVALQTLLNACLRRRDVLAESIRSAGRPGSKTTPGWPVYVLAAVLIMPALFLTAMSVLLRRGDVMTFTARKRD